MSDLILDQVPVGQRAEGVGWDVTDIEGRTIGALHGVGGTLGVQTASSRMRTCTSVSFAASDLDAINPFTDWVRPLWLLEDGSRVPMGLLTFVADPQTISSGRVARNPTMHDGGALLDVPMVDSLGAPPGTSVYGLAVTCLEAAGIPNFYVAATDLVFLTSASPVGGNMTYRQVLNACATLAGWLPPFFDRNGACFLLPPPDLTQAPDVAYTGRRIINGTRVVNPNLLDAPNAHRVVSTGPGSEAIRAIAYVDPSAPHSRENRGGRVIIKDHNLQGIPDVATAQAMADRYAAADPASFETIDFAGSADPRHDVFSVIGVNAINYMETVWNLELKAGGRMTHHVQRSGAVISGL